MAYDNSHVWVVYNVLTAPQMTQVSDNIGWMYANGMYLIETKTSAGASASFDFTGIPATYSSLRLVYQLRSLKNSALDDYIRIRINADAGNNYYGYTIIHGYDNIALDAEDIAQSSLNIESAPGALATAGLTAAGEITFPFYAETTFHKILRGIGYVGDTNASGHQYSRDFSARWGSTAAINEINLYLTTGNLTAGSKASLYGMH